MKKRLAAWALCITMILTSAAPVSAAAAQPQQAAPSVADTLPQELAPAPLTADEPAEQNTPEDDTVPASGEPTPGNDTTPGDSEPTSGDDTTPGDSETTPGDDATPDSGEPAPGDSTTPDDGEPTHGDDATPDDGEPTPGGDATPNDGESAPADDATPDDGEPTPGDDATPDDGEPVSGAAGGTSANALPDADSAPAQQPGSESYTITPGINAIGFAGVTVELLQGIQVDPAQDAQGNTILVRVADITSTDPDYRWDEQNTLTPGEGNVVYTITYEAYVQPEQGEEIVYATLKFPYTVRGDGTIGPQLDGDWAYISEAALLPDDTTTSKLAMRTGSAPWDKEEGPGNDQNDLDNTVRTFDIVSYTAYFKSKVREGAPFSFYETGTLHFEFVLPGTKEEARFETGSMGWLSAKKDVQYEITESTYNGEPCQVLRGSYLWEPSDENPSAIGESYQELTLVVRALALKNGDTLKPEFTFWLDYNDVPEEGLVTGSNHSCSEHDEAEYKTITAPDVGVTSAPRFNVQLKGGIDSLSYVDTFDFGTGNDSAANKDIGTKEGRVSGYGITLQIQGKSPQHGLRGCELPDGSDITLELDLSSIYRTDEGEEKELFDDYPLLLWSIEGQSKNSTQADGRVINGLFNYVPGLAPVNEGVHYDCCYNGGTWKATQTDGTISITVSGYEVNTDYFPHANSGTAVNDVSYYNPDEISQYWEIQNACFSAGEVWLVQSFYDEQGTYVVEKEGSGTFSTTVKDVSLNVTGKSGTALPEVPDNSNQETTEDDRSVVTVFLSRSGTISANIAYLKYGKSSAYELTSLTENCIGNGKDWVLSEGKLAISAGFDHANAEGVSTGVAYDTLIKFDDTFFQPDGTYQLYDSYYSTGKVTVLFGAKEDKTGWNHSRKSPHEADYDTEMMKATADDLIFFSSLDDLKNAGYTCVAVLAECRGIYSTQRTSHFLIVNGTVNPEAKSGSVYMCTVASKGWNKSNVQEAVAEYQNKDASALTDEDYNTYVKSAAFPSRAGKTTSLSYKRDYPSSFWTYDYENVDGLRTYKKAIYDENGFVNATGGRLYGDSCLVVGYATEITKSTAQQSSSLPKEAYDMDVGQRIADYVLYPSAVRSAGESSTGGELTTTVYVEDTLPKGLTYITNSSYWGGTYTQTDEGKQGVVEGGQQIKPDITVHSDGTTTLRWTLEKVPITSKEVTEIAPIYYSCDIGKPGDEENDVQNNDQLLNTAIIWSDDEQRRDFEDYNNNLADFSILISKNNAVSLSKLADQAVVDQGDTMGFTLNVGNNATNPMAVIAVDSLPYVGDAAGSAFTGDCVVTEYTITALQGEFASNFKLYYTTSESERGKGSENYTKEDFTKEGSVWTELAVNSTDGTVTLPEREFKPVAIAAVGTLPAQQTLKMHVTMDLPDAKPGEYVANRLTRGDLESFGRSYIVSRTLEGVVWLDDDQNGLRAADETRIGGVQATLMQLKKDGDPADPADYTPYQISDGSGGYKSATVATGCQLDLSTGEQITLGAGRYKFTNLPQGTFGVRFTDGTFQLGAYTASPQNVGSDDTLDSDAAPTYGTDGALTQAFIAGIEMPALEQITTMVYASRDHDLGLYPTTYRLTVSKTVTGALGDRDKLFEFKLTLNDAAGKPITDSFTYTGASTVEGVAAPADGTLNVTAGAAAFRLKHGQSITIAGLPPQCGYTVTEPNAETDGYDVSITVNDEAAESAKGTLTADAAVAFINSREPATPTGILLDSAPMLALVGLSLAGGALLAAGRRRRRTGAERR